MIYLIIGIMAAIFLAGLFSGMETGYYTLNKTRLFLKSNEGDKNARRVLAHLSRPAWLITVLLVGTNICIDLATHLGEGLLTRVLQALGAHVNSTLLPVVNTVLLTPLIFFFGEVVPKTLFRTYTESLTYRFSGVLSLAGAVLSPIVLFLKWPASMAARTSKSAVFLSPLAGREGLKAMLGHGKKAHGLSKMQAELADKLLVAQAEKLHEVMIKLKDVEVFDEETPKAVFLERVGNSQRERFPVHQSGNPRKIKGYIYFLDLLYDKREDARVKDHLRRLESVPWDMEVENALLLFQRKGLRMGLVVGRRQEPLGIVDVKLLWERITGPLSKE